MKVTVGKGPDFKLTIPDSDTIVFPTGFSHPIPLGAITDRVTRVDLQSAEMGTLGAGVIPNSVTHLFLMIVTGDIVIPSSVTDLFVRDFQSHMLEFVPSTVTNLYIHMANRGSALQYRVHHLFYFHDWKINEQKCDADKYVLSKQSTILPFYEKLRVIKRTPLSLAALPVEGHIVDKVPAVEDCIVVGETYTKLEFADTDSDVLVLPADFEHKIRPGSIPNRYVQLVFPKLYPHDLEAQVVPDSVTHLAIPRLTSSTVIPSSVEHLFITDPHRDFDQDLVPSTVTHLYINNSSKNRITKPIVHYRCFHGRHSNIRCIRNSRGYIATTYFTGIIFGKVMTVTKLTPVVVLDSPCDSIPTTESLGSEVLAIKEMLAALTVKVDQLVAKLASI